MLLTVMSAMQITGPDAISLPWADELNCTFLNYLRKPS